MVYCGKPSRGCQMCRTRRIKCDETKPTCNQCAKSRRQCPGYKDDFDLVFRNETIATERRARKANKKAFGQKTAGEDDAELVDPAIREPFGTNFNQLSIVAALNQPIDEQASCHFISNYVLVPHQGGTRGFMDFLPSLLRGGDQTTHLRHAFDACALASLSNRVGAGKEFEKKALGHYTKALAATSKALRDPSVAQQDATLASVLLLGLYENMSAKQMGSLNWGSHTEGAIQLVKARGRAQLQTPRGVTLFIAVRTQLIIYTLTTGKAPPMGSEWWTADAVINEQATSCQRLNIQTGELRAEVNRLLGQVNRSPENVDIMLKMLRRCQSLDQECANWSNSLPNYFEVKTAAWEDHVPQGDYTKAEVFPGRVDAYQDLWIASVWNMLRCSRLILGSMIVRCAAWICSPVDYRTTREYATAARTAVDLLTDIIASVPYQLGWFRNRIHLLEKAYLSSFCCGEEDAQKGLPGYLLTWPLTIVLGQDYTSDSQRAWAKGRLVYISNHLGVRYAHMLAQLHVRIPSMLIRRDGLLASPYPMAHDFEKLVSTRTERLDSPRNGTNKTPSPSASA